MYKKKVRCKNVFVAKIFSIPCQLTGTLFTIESFLLWILDNFVNDVIGIFFYDVWQKSFNTKNLWQKTSDIKITFLGIGQPLTFEYFCLLLVTAFGDLFEKCCIFSMVIEIMVLEIVISGWDFHISTQQLASSPEREFTSS